MTVLERMRGLFERERTPFEVLRHAPAFTAQEVAQAQHVPGRELAKVVIAIADGRPVMAVLPATARLDLHKLADAAGAHHCRLASEPEFAGLFPLCELGAMPPIGRLFGLPVYADRGLADDEHVVFQAGTHTETVRMRWADFAEVARPTLADLTLIHEDV